MLAATSSLALVTVVTAQDAPRGAALLALAQRSIGGGKGLAGVKTLQVTGTFRRVVDGIDTDGDFEVFIELPDKYLRSEKTGTPGQPSTEVVEALIGADVRDIMRGGGGRGRATQGGDGPAPKIGDDTTAARDGVPNDAPQAEATAVPVPAAGPGRGGAADPEAQRRARQADVSRLLLMWLLKSEVPLVWVGIAEAPDGKADVLEATYVDGRPTRLFLESNTHMPLMMQWDAAPAGAGGAGGRRGGAPDGAGTGAGARQGGPPSLVTFDMTFSDHREVNGIRLPHLITRGVNGQTRERWTISRYRVNPALGADAFTR